MKLAVVGCGALGSYYGAMLCRSGLEVHFLLRSDYDVVRRRGVRIVSPKGDFHVNPKCARDPADIGPCDLVLIGLKTTANDQFPVLLPPLVGPQTMVATLQNGLGNEARLAGLFGGEKILGGLCFVCLNRLEPGVIRHLEHGTVVLGEYLRYPEPRTHTIAGLFRHAGVSCKVTDNLERAHWEKLIWNIPFNGLGVAGAAGYEAVLSGKLSDRESVTHRTPLATDALLRDPRWENLVRELMLEVIAGARALGHDLPLSKAEDQIERTRTMGAYRASTLIDFEKGLPLELDSLFREPLRQAQAAGARLPRLKALCDILEGLAKGMSNVK